MHNIKRTIALAQKADLEGDVKKADTLDKQAMDMMKEAGWWDDLKQGVGNAWDTAKQGVGSAWQGTKDTAGNAWQSAGDWTKRTLQRTFTPTHKETGEYMTGSAEGNRRVDGFIAIYSAAPPEQKQQLIQEYQNYLTEGQKNQVKQQLAGDPYINSL